MAISDADILHLARLANLAPRPEHLPPLQAELNNMLSLIKTLQAVDTTGIQPMTHPMAEFRGAEDHLRDDTAAPTNTPEQRDALMSNAPARVDGLFLVPTVIE